METHDFKAAGVFTTEDSLNDYLKALGAAILLFTVLFYVTKFVSNLIGNETFQKLSPKVKAEYHSRVVSTIHGTTAFVLAYISVWRSCDDPNESIFTSTECIMNPKPV